MIFRNPTNSSDVTTLFNHMLMADFFHLFDLLSREAP